MAKCSVILSITRIKRNLMLPIPVWTDEIQGHPYETDLNNEWKAAAFFQAFQDVANAHAANLGFDYHTMLAADHI